MSRVPEDKNTGFEAAAFQNGTEIVISYAGTNSSDFSGDIVADGMLAAGRLSKQLTQAAEYYLRVKAGNSGAISFTGHSLGGGLASLMAVMFGEPAFTFDQAPFLNSAKTHTSIDIDTGVKRTSSVAEELLSHLAGSVSDKGLLAKLEAYITACDPSNPTPIAEDTLAGRSKQVTNINNQGEFLSEWFLVPSSNRIGSQSEIPNSNDISGLDLHSQALLTAFLQSNQTASSYMALNDATLKLIPLHTSITNAELARISYPLNEDSNLLHA